MKQSLCWSLPFWLCLIDNWKIHSCVWMPTCSNMKRKGARMLTGGWRLYSIFTKLIKSAFPITEDPFWWYSGPLDLEFFSQAERQQDVDLWALSDAWAAARASWSRGHGHIISEGPTLWHTAQGDLALGAPWAWAARYSWCGLSWPETRGNVLKKN